MFTQRYCPAYQRRRKRITIGWAGLVYMGIMRSYDSDNVLRDCDFTMLLLLLFETPRKTYLRGTVREYNRRDSKSSQGRNPPNTSSRNKNSRYRRLFAQVAAKLLFIRKILMHLVLLFIDSPTSDRLCSSINRSEAGAVAQKFNFLPVERTLCMELLSGSSNCS